MLLERGGRPCHRSGPVPTYPLPTWLHSGGGTTRILDAEPASNSWGGLPVLSTALGVVAGRRHGGSLEMLSTFPATPSRRIHNHFLFSVNLGKECPALMPGGGRSSVPGGPECLFWGSHWHLKKKGVPKQQQDEQRGKIWELVWRRGSACLCLGGCVAFRGKQKTKPTGSRNEEWFSNSGCEMKNTNQFF